MAKAIEVIVKVNFYTRALIIQLSRAVVVMTFMYRNIVLSFASALILHEFNLNQNHVGH